MVSKEVEMELGKKKKIIRTSGRCKRDIQHGG